MDSKAYILSTAPVFLPARWTYSSVFGRELALWYLVTQWLRNKNWNCRCLWNTKTKARKVRKCEATDLQGVAWRQTLSYFSARGQLAGMHVTSAHCRDIRVVWIWLVPCLSGTSVLIQKIGGFSLISRRFSLPFLFHHSLSSTVSAQVFWWPGDCVSIILYVLTHVTLVLCIAVGPLLEVPKDRSLKSIGGRKDI